MHLKEPVKPSGRKWSHFALSFCLVVAGIVIAYWALPDRRGLVLLGAYTIPSHMFVSPFPHEPMLLYYAKFNPAWECALVSMMGCLVAGFWDYWLFVPLVHHQRVRSKYVNTGLYKRFIGLFRISPFFALVIVGLTPIPFYPVKFLSISDGYPLKRYLAALVVGRGPRYYVLAYLGYVLKLPNWSLVALALVLLGITVYQNRRRNNRAETLVDGSSGSSHPNAS